MNLKKTSTLLLAMMIAAQAAHATVAPVNRPQASEIAAIFPSQALTARAVAAVRYGHSALSPGVQRMATIAVLLVGVSLAAHGQNPFDPFTSVTEAADVNTQAVHAADLANKTYIWNTADNEQALVDAFPSAEAAVGQAVSDLDTLPRGDDPLGVVPELLIRSEDALQLAQRQLPKESAAPPLAPLNTRLKKGLRQFLNPKGDFLMKRAVFGGKRELFLMVLDRLPVRAFYKAGQIASRRRILPPPTEDRVASVAYILMGGSMKDLDERYKNFQAKSEKMNDNVATLLQQQKKLALAEKKLRALKINSSAAFQKVEALRSRAIDAYDSHSYLLAATPEELKINAPRAYEDAWTAQHDWRMSLPSEQITAVSEWYSARIDVAIFTAKQKYYESQREKSRVQMKGELEIAQDIFVDKKLGRFKTPEFMGKKSESTVQRLINAEKKSFNDNRSGHSVGTAETYRRRLSVILFRRWKLKLGPRPAGVHPLHAPLLSAA
jgi:hypothetical protein